MSKAKILVTGGFGFIGCTLVPTLVSLGYRVVVLDNLSQSAVKAPLCDHQSIIGDIRNEEDVSTSLKGVDIVIHLAASGSVVPSVNDPVPNYDNNVFGTFNLLNCCRKVGIKKFILASTGGALMGNTPPPVSENSLPAPISPYGSSKLCCEAYCSSFAHSYNMSVVALRFANVIGPFSYHKKGAVTAFFKSILNNKPINIYGNGDASRDFLYVSDLCDGIISSITTNFTGFNVFHLSSGVEHSILDLANMIKRVTGRLSHPVIFHRPRLGEVDNNFASNSKAKKFLLFDPQTNLENSIDLCWNWFKAYHDK